jgi:hypothetical protein
MTDAAETKHAWQIAGASVRGASHIHLNLPNQDAALWFVDPARHVLAFAVADGHGAPVYSRSDRGAQLAVTTAVSELRALADDGEPPQDLAPLCERLLTRWREMVRADIAKFPLAAGEAAALAAQSLDRSSAYGATLLTAFMTPTSGFVIQIGDGAIYLVDRDGRVQTAVTTPDLPGESTYSLCMTDALDVIETRRFAEGEIDRLGAVVLSTDGYSKSFRNDEAAAAQIKAITDRFSWDGAAAMSQELEVWLQRVSEAGSGDDISLIVAARQSR